MLYEIICDKFKQRRVEFHSGLNTVLGTNIGTNSIGKSTFLMIVDFVFGGSTYANASDVIKNVGHHNICFSFIFDKEQYWFIRNTLDFQNVWVCNSNYKKESNLTIKEFNTLLNKQYRLELPNISFRDVVGRYIRVYGKENINEKLPLHVAQGEKAKKASYALLKLFNLYVPISNLEAKHKLSKEELNVFKKAQKHNFITSINKRQFSKNEKEILALKKEIRQIADGLEKGLSDLDAELSEEAIRVKLKLSKAKRLRSRLKSKLNVIDENLTYKFSMSTSDFKQLERFFPNVNLADLSEIEQFHSNISSVLDSEFKAEKNQLKKELADADKVVNEYNLKLEKLIKDPKISKTILTKYSHLQRQVDNLVNQNTAYTKSTELKNSEKQDKNRLKTIENEQFAILDCEVNKKMDKINDYIYSGTYNSPILKNEEASYKFFTPDDTGTGIAYKGLIVFDLSVLALTKLPILVHDSVLLKQISDVAIEKILALYKNSNKQIIISLDKQESYTKKSQVILNEKAVLRLSPGGKELFGRSWA